MINLQANMANGNTAIFKRSWQPDDEDDLSELYPTGGLNAKQYYEYVDKYLPRKVDKPVAAATTKSNVINEINVETSTSEILDTSAQIQLAAIVNKDKGRRIGTLPTTYDALITESVSVIGEEIETMLRLEDDSTDYDYKLCSSKTRKTYEDSDSGKLCFVGLKQPVRLNDDFFDLAAQNQLKNGSGSSSANRTDDCESSSTVASCTTSTNTSSSLCDVPLKSSTTVPVPKKSSEEEEEDELFLARAKARYAQASIGVPDERFVRQSNQVSSLGDYIDTMLVGQRKHKRERKTKSPKELEKCKNNNDDVHEHNDVVTPPANEDKETELPGTNGNKQSDSDHVSMEQKLEKLNIKYYTPLEIYNLKRNKSKS